MDTRNSTESPLILDNWFIQPELLELGEEIGRGSFGAVIKAKYSGTDVAVKKVLETTCEAVDSLVHEACILQKLRHPNVVLFMGVCKANETYSIVQEYAKGGSLHKLVSNPRITISPMVQIKFVLEISQALSYIHTKNLLHRDLKLENILLDSNSFGATSVGDLRCKIADFGLSILHDPSKKTPLETVGTLWWRAPEVDGFDSYDERADIFSFGIVVMEILTKCSGEDIRVAMSYQKKDSLGKPLIGKFGVNSNVLRTEFGEPMYHLNPVLLGLSVDCCQEEPAVRPSMSHIIDKVLLLQNTLAPITEEASSKFLHKHFPSFTTSSSTSSLNLFSLASVFSDMWISAVYETLDINPVQYHVTCERLIQMISAYLKVNSNYALKAKETNALITMLLNFQDTQVAQDVSEDVELTGFALFCEWFSSCLQIIDFLQPYIKANFIEGFVLKEEASEDLKIMNRDKSLLCRFSTSTNGTLVITCLLNEEIIHVHLLVDQLGFFIEEQFYQTFKECFQKNQILSQMMYVYPDKSLGSFESVLATPHSAKKLYNHQGSIIATKRRPH